MEILIRKTKKIVKAIGWSILVVIMLLIGFHIWFINHSEKTIERLIAWRSNGKLRANIKKLSIDYFNNNAEIKELTIYNADSVSRGTAYRFTTQQLHFNIRSKWDLIFHRKLLVDSLVFSAPDIIITRKSHLDSTFKKLPLAEELGNVYKAINNSLAVLNLERFEINNGKVVVKDAGPTGKIRFELGRIFLLIDHLSIDSSKIRDRHLFAFSDRVVLYILKQTVNLPDNKSSISFNRLLIDSKKGVVEILEPGIKIYPPKGFKSSFIASASQLNITGLDFNTLYNQPLINIDSVFMQNPQGDLQVYRKERQLKNKKQMPLDDALRNLPVAVNINHVVVQNGTVALALHQAGKTTVFDTKKDNLSISGVSLNDTAAKALSIKGFNYLIRNNSGYTADSIYRYRFDSLQFIDNKIILYNFNIATIKKVQSILIRNYNVPKFEITDMDWPSFLFNNHFRASKAVLYNAVFNIEKNSDLNIKNVTQKENKKSIYQTLSVMDNLLDLDELKVVNGEFNAKQGEDLSLHIGHLNWDINANELTQATTFQQLIHSVKELSFDTATAANAAMRLHVSKSIFNNADKRLLFKNVLLNTNNQSITASLNNVAVSDFSFDNKELDVNEIHWNDGVIHIDGRNMDGDKVRQINKKKYAFSLNNISGNNSALFFVNDDIKAQINVTKLTASNLSKSDDHPFQINKLRLDGENAMAHLLGGQLTCKTVTIRDGEESFLKDILFVRKTANDTINVQLSTIGFIPFINKTITTNTVAINSVDFETPKLFYASNTKISGNQTAIAPMQLPAMLINGLNITGASAKMFFTNGVNKSVIDVPNISLVVQKIITKDDKSLLFNSLGLVSNYMSIKNNNNQLFTSNGNITATVNNFLFNPSTQNWQLQLNNFTADQFNYLNKITVDSAKQLNINKIDVEHVNLNNEEAAQGLPWFVNKSSAILNCKTIQWQTSTANFQVNDLLFNANKKQIIFDSIFLNPIKEKGDFENKLIYRKAYITANAGKTIIDGISYLNDLIHIPHLISNNIYLNIYSDNLKKANVQRIKLLPVDAIKKIDQPLQIDTFQVNNMAIDYTEINALTKKTGFVNLNTINGQIINIYTKPTATTDSLRCNFSANFLGGLPFNFAMQASNTDSLKGFALQLNVGAGNAQLLNPILEPFILLRTKTGFIDTMYMSAVANDYSAHGTMRLYYHGLTAELLDSSLNKHPRFRTRLFSFLANSFAIRNNNNKRITSFNLNRTRTKSAINYLVKMIVEGAAGNVMPQASKILIKKQLKKEAKRQEALEQNL